MADQLEVINAALLILGQNALDSPSDGSDTAIAAGALFPRAYGWLLTMHPWNFAGKEATLARDSVAASVVYTYSYQLPNDFMKIRRLVNATGVKIGKFERLGRSVCTDETSVTLRYTYDAPINWVPEYALVPLITKLASYLAGPIREDMSLAQSLSASAFDECRVARSFDSQEDYPQTFQDFSIVSVRGGYIPLEGETS